MKLLGFSYPIANTVAGGNAAPGREVLKASEHAQAPAARQKHKH
jgi:hypothetical protein